MHDPLRTPPPPRPNDPAQAFGAAMTWMVRAKAVFTILSGLVVAVASMIALSSMRAVAADQGIELSGLAHFTLNHSWVVLLLALLSMAGGIWLLVTPLWRWPVLLLSTVALIAPVLLLLITMISVMAPLYNPS